MNLICLRLPHFPFHDEDDERWWEWGWDRTKKKPEITFFYLFPFFFPVSPLMSIKIPSFLSRPKSKSQFKIVNHSRVMLCSHCIHCTFLPRRIEKLNECKAHKLAWRRQTIEGTLSRASKRQGKRLWKKVFVWPSRKNQNVQLSCFFLWSSAFTFVYCDPMKR